MTGPYDDLLDLPHPVSKTRAHMSMTDRGAQFSPFAALVGYDAAIREAGRLTDGKTELTDCAREALDEKLRRIAREDRDSVEISAVYFVPDLKKSGGSYRTAVGTVGKIDPLEGILELSDGTKIPLDDLISLDSRLFARDPNGF